MSDSRIPALINSLLTGAVRSDAARANIISLPPALQNASVISGQVMQNKNGQVTIQTDQGPVVFQTDLALQVGQKIDIKLQVATQNAQQQMTADLIVVTDARGRPVAPSSLQASALPQPQPAQSASTPQAPQRPVEVSGLAQQFEHIDANANDLQQILQAPVQDMQAKTIAIPQALTEQDVENLIRTVLNLAPQQPLPQTVQEGLAKFQTLLPLLNANLALPEETPISAPIPTTAPVVTPATIPQAVQQPVASQAAPLPIINTLLQIFQTAQKTPVLQQFLTDLAAHPLLLLQQITPGQSLSPGILQVLKDQVTILQQKIIQATQPAVPAETPSPEKAAVAPVKTSPLDMLTSLASRIKTPIQNLIPGAAPQPIQETVYQPLLGLVLGQSNTVPQLLEKAPILLFLMTATGQNVVSLSTFQNTQASQLPLLPGSVILAAVNQKETLTVLPMTLSGAAPLFDAASDMPLHVAVGNSWPVLEKLWQEVLAQQVAHPTVMTAMQQTIPMPTVQQMPPSALFFLAVLKNGFLGNWAGADALRDLPMAQKVELIGQLTRDMQAIQSAMTDNIPTNSWRPLPMPLNVNDQMYRMQWFYRHQYDMPEPGQTMTEEERRRKRKTRFLVEVPKTKVGDIQIDGLVQEKKLDVILRTENILQSTMQNNILQRYIGALETTGFAGGLIFQAGREHYVHA